ncbi:unnamed protein product [Soboliphyme baturini]|uniref:Ion_trans_2 domain-containing protein n=1 Tax=Soboliphyme baturini TaxID=241478 RepID=A0A183IZB6_9BILA|nr:unnamed protein product [Soboliphyme baturini]
MELRKSCGRLYHQLGLGYLSPVFCILLYTLFGALLFLFIEQPHDQLRQQQLHNSYLRARSHFVRSLYRLHTDSAAANDSSHLIQELYTAVSWYESQINVSFTNESMWDLWNSLYYAGTIFTTIGKLLLASLIEPIQRFTGTVSYSR